MAAELFCLSRYLIGDRIIRNDRELQAIRTYIVNNPLNWKEDSENPQNWGIVE
jgi:hypothetical protein